MSERTNMRQWHIADEWLNRDALMLLARETDSHGTRVLRFEVQLEEIKRGAFVSTDVGLKLSHDDAQQIMDELWRNGVRPREGSGTLAHVDAMRSHLDDMRKIAFEGKGS